jgi:hypothetical protein
MRNALRWIVVLGCLVGGRAAAQGSYVVDPYADEVGLVGPLVWNFGGQVAFPLGPSADRVGTGWGFAVGLTFNPKPVYGLQFEYGADWASLLTGKVGAGSDITGDAFLQYFDLNAVLRPIHSGRVTVYLVGGGGLYYRSARVTRITGTTLAPYCDPWLYYCSAVPVSTGTVLGSRHSWDWGLDAGVGLAFGAGPGVRFYLEARYHYIFGPSFTDSTGASRTADGQYLPVTLGVKF